MHNDPVSILTGRIGFMLAVLSIILAGIAIIFVNTDGTITGPAIVPTLASLYALVTGGWAVYQSRTDTPRKNVLAMLEHMTTIGFIVIAAIGFVAWTRSTEDVPAILATLVGLQAPIAVFLAKRYLTGKF